ncbi:MAG: hypothetical protein JSW66_07455 [Phycisphaerales bacterium]|nr:MAG: hypothetical protein JSW66_07455 [Phycisphaerales bacterium]
MGPASKQKRYLFTGGGHWLKERVDSSIKLEDGSLWQVNLVDRIVCSLWLCNEKIVVAKNQNPDYPYLLINTDDGEKVEARLISD